MMKCVVLYLWLVKFHIVIEYNFVLNIELVNQLHIPITRIIISVNFQMFRYLLSNPPMYQ